MTVWSQTTRD